MVRGADGEYHTITGNQMGVLLLDYIITARRRKRHAAGKRGRDLDDRHVQNGAPHLR